MPPGKGENMENVNISNNGILKSNSRLARAKQYWVAAVFGAFVAIVALGASVGMVLGLKSNNARMDSIVHEFIETQEYKTQYDEQYKSIKNSGKFFEEFAELRSYDHAVELLKSSENNELKDEYIQKEKMADGLSTNGMVSAGIAIVGGGIGAAFAGLSSREDTKRKKEEKEETEENMA